ncbi:unnamed protein product [Arctia plantaginis]|uniref:Uncharacterized protein n=1 Tax=Arctia plantaginis TaxID=874455 RepID=A0A8S0YRQ3_ARCPL|nr:unnamed protein product [Arctia plantaginis]
MSNNNPINDKKKALLAYKEKLFEEMQYYDKRIEEFRTNHRNKCYYDDSDSSEAEDYFPNMVDTGPEVPQLKAEQSLLKTCLQATQELTNLTVLQSEINVLVQDPQLDGEKPVTEPGTWQEVTAECRIDLVPFTIVFYMHTPNRKFGSTSYRGLQLSLVKKSHEMELNNSVLHTLRRPSDAVEVIRSYAVGYRSRRTTLARLANKYASSLFMEPHPEGGFVLKCANLLEILWRLENKWSPVAPFHHRMKFDLEYMDESYIKTITQAHKQLLDPAIQTDERTLLLSKIINTCLEARGPVDSESDLESKQTDALTETDPKDRDSEVMAPPKSLPKKTKKITAKDKKISEDALKEKTTPQKRSMADDSGGAKAKKVKTTENSNGEAKKLAKSNEKCGENKKKNKSNGENEGVKKNSNENVDTAKNMKNSDKSKQINKKIIKKHHTEVISKISVDSGNENNKNTANIAKKKKNNENVPVATKNNKKDNKELKKTKSNEELKRNNVRTGESEPKKIKSSSDINKTDTQNFDDKADNVTNKPKNKIRVEKNSKEKKNDDIEYKESETFEATKTAKGKPKNNKNNEQLAKKIDRKVKMSIANDKKFDQITKKISGDIRNKNLDNMTKNIENNSTKIVSNSKNVIVNTKMEAGQGSTNITKKKTINVPKTTESQNNNDKEPKSTETVKNKSSGNTKDIQTVKTFTEKNAINIKNTEKIINVNKVVTQKIVKDKPTTIFNKPENIVISTSTPKNNMKLSKITTKSVRNIIHKSPKPKNSIKIQNSQKSIKTKISNGNTQVFSGNSENENGGKTSKIPQKKMSFNSEKILKTNILRISPRRLPSKFKPITQDANVKQLTKTTNIPRFIKKTAPKVSK